MKVTKKEKRQIDRSKGKYDRSYAGSRMISQARRIFSSVFSISEAFPNGIFSNLFWFQILTLLNFTLILLFFKIKFVSHLSLKVLFSTDVMWRKEDVKNKFWNFQFAKKAFAAEWNVAASLQQLSKWKFDYLF